MPLEISFQLSLFGRTLPERCYQMTGWIFLPSSSLSAGRRNSNACLWTMGIRRNGGRGRPDLAWRTMDAQHWASPRLARRQRIFLVADFGGRRAGEILFKPRPMLPLSEPGTACGVPAAQGDRGPFLETGGRVPIVRPFQLFRMRGAAKRREHVQFRDSFGFPTDPFPTLLASDVAPFAFWYEDDPWAAASVFPQSGNVSG